MTTEPSRTFEALVGARWRISLGSSAAMIAIYFGFIFLVAFDKPLLGARNFPALVLSIFWKRLTTRGAQLSMLVGTVSTVLFIVLSPTIQIDILKYKTAIFPLRNPGIVTIPLAFAVAIAASLLRREAASARGFVELERRLHLGVE